MPARKIKLSNGKFRVVTPNGVHGKEMTEANADRQVRLLNAVDHGWKPTGAPAAAGAQPDKIEKKFPDSKFPPRNPIRGAH